MTRLVGTYDADGYCDVDERDPYGGITALWSGTTGASAVAVFVDSGWERHDPRSGPPAWLTEAQRPGDGRRVPAARAFDNEGFGALNAKGRAHQKSVVVLTKTIGGRDYEVTVSRDGARALIYGI